MRILLQHIHIGVNLRDILSFLNPFASDIHNSTNSLKELCTLLSDPQYVRLLKATIEKNTQDIMENNRYVKYLAEIYLLLHPLIPSPLHYTLSRFHSNIWMTPSHLPAVIQKTLSPMLSRRTNFHTFLKEIAHRHSQMEKVLPAESPAKSCLAIKHPAIACEIKMDGERDLIHIKRGIVTVCTRRGTWYSPIYSPAIGPSLRAAIAAYDVDVILDGEMIAWDSFENKPIPFGSNRTVAEIQRNRRQKEGTIDPRDMDLHKNDLEINVMTISKDKQLKKGGGIGNIAVAARSSDQHWLQYVIFDIIYVDGPGAKDLISKSSHLFGKDEPIKTGSIINMDLMQRKSILYNLIRPQKNEVEHNRCVIVRSDGTSMDACDYFLGKNGLEYGKTPCELDSVYLALCDKSETTKFDTQRRGGRSHEEIEIQRSMELEKLYNDVVTTGGQEGLLFKDLASPYYLGVTSRNMGYWWKIKVSHLL